VDTLTAALWYLLNWEDYLEIVLKAVDLGGNTDTTGIVAGVHGGLAAVPQNWRDGMARAEDLTAVFERFSASCGAPCLIKRLYVRHSSGPGPPQALPDAAKIRCPCRRKTSGSLGPELWRGHLRGEFSAAYYKNFQKQGFANGRRPPVSACVPA
jgi:hypothetical protein